MDTIIDFVYYYPPPNVYPNELSNISQDIYGMIIFDLVNGTETPIGNSLALGYSQTQIKMTPQAYTAWYNNNLSAITQSSMYNIFKFYYTTNPQATTSTDTYLSKNGFYWKPYNSNYQSLYNVLSSATNPTAEGYTTNQLYMLIKPQADTISYTPTTAGGFTVNQTPTQSAQTLADQNNLNTQVATSIITSPQQVYNDTPQGQIQKGVVNTASNIGKTISNPFFDLEVYGLVGLLILGIVFVATR